ncbi:MAG: hypothetical protein RBS80_28855 [Thermoguttaceae bacterium]|jgi:hypothetical protein|nr:hypothetical protein [Thermoguttaceae bacterium]
MRNGRFDFLAWMLGGWITMAALGGCGRGPDLPPTAPVSGTVTLDGNPLPRGTVQFVPDQNQGTSGTPAVGNIGPDGRYTLHTAGVRGAIVGHHKVRIEAQAEPKNEMDTWPPSLIPERYNNEQSSGLSFEVTAGGGNEINIELTSR